MRSKSWSFLAFVGIALAGCATPTPQTAITKLNMKDPKFTSPECVDIRAKSLTYDDKVGERAVTGMALGLFLGPLGLPAAAATDAAQEEQRHAYYREIMLRCVTGGEEIVAKDDAERRSIVQDVKDRKGQDIH